MNRREVLSLLYALLEGISYSFDIERRDINGVIYKNVNGNYDLIIFDNVPGGAGHVKRILNKEGLISAFKAAYNNVNHECCDEETSCYNCLRNYNNQKIHKDLKRRYARDILRDILIRIE